MKEISITRMSEAAYAINQHMVREIAKAVEEYNGKFTLRFKKTLEKHFDKDYKVEVRHGRGKGTYDIIVMYLPSNKGHAATDSNKLDEHATSFYAHIDALYWDRGKRDLFQNYGFDQKWRWEWQEANKGYLTKLAALEEEARGKLVELGCVKEVAWKLLNEIPKPESCRKMWEDGVRDEMLSEAFPLTLGDDNYHEYWQFLRKMFSSTKGE